MKVFPTVALIGRTNVGKSTLFNRLIEQRKALVSPESGTTRDRNFGVVHWRGKRFNLIDTGGLDLGYLPKTKLPKKLKLSERVDPDDLIETNIIKQAEMGIKQADFLMMVVDGQAGLQPEDRTVANIIRKSGKPYLLVVNKLGNVAEETSAWEFAQLGLGDPVPIAAITGRGTGELLDILLPQLKFSPGRYAAEPERISVSFIGRPNVGKSSLLNSILGEERVIVSPFAGTTREAQDAAFNYKDHEFTLIDTAGIRRKSRVAPGLERAGVKHSFRNLKASDVAVLVVDISQRISAQDTKLAQEIIDANCGLIIVANKWDLIPDKDTYTQDRYVKYIRAQFPSLHWAPIAFTSAKTGRRVTGILDEVIAIHAEQRRTVAPKKLELILKKAVKRHLPAQAKGRAHPYIYTLQQTGTEPPRFELLIHQKAQLHKSYLRYLENQIRQEVGYIGTPIIVTQRFYKK